MPEGGPRRPNSADAQANLAWRLATCPSAVAARRRRGRSNTRGWPTGSATADRPRLLDALAAAYAELGRFPEAISAARNALALAEPREPETGRRHPRPAGTLSVPAIPIGGCLAARITAGTSVG